MLSQSEKKALCAYMWDAYQPLADGLSALNCAITAADVPADVDKKLTCILREGLQTALEATVAALDVCEGGKR